MSHGKNQSSHATKIGEKQEPPIPNDLIIEIFSRLPGYAIARFRCLSKLWSFMLRRSYFTKLFFTRSSSRPRLLFLIKAVNKDEWSIYSSPQHQNPYGNSSLVVAAEFHMKFNGILHQDISYTSGLVSFQISKKLGDTNTMHVICNPITREYVTLPQPIKYKRSILGFDPIDKRFKLLVEAYNILDYPSIVYAHYFNPERNTLQSVEIKGVEKGCRVVAFVDHVEDLNLNDAKELKSRKQRLNIIKKSQKPQKTSSIS